MVQQLSPCKDCQNKYTACHDTCVLFKEWKDAISADKKKYTEDKMKRKQISETMEILRNNMKTKKASNRF